MNLAKKRMLASKTLKVGKERIIFAKARLDEIKDAITKQDIRELNRDGAILIREIRGRKTIVKRKKRGPGKIKKKMKEGKREYMTITRKLRAHVSALKESGKITREESESVRKKIRDRIFKSKAALTNYIGGLKR